MSWSDDVRAGRWAAFRGLPEGLDELDLLAGLGRGAKAAEARRLVVLGHAERTLAELEGLRYWLDDRQVVLVELDDPPSALPALPALEMLAVLGQPDRERAARHLRFGATTTEYVYAARGLALTLAESYDSPPAFEPFLAVAQLFAPTDLRRFLADLGGGDRHGPRA